MRILVTGGAGFLGSHLVEKLLLMKHEVVCADNLFTGSLRNIDKFRDNKNFEFIRHDITFPLYIEVEGVFNLGCPASPVQYQKHPVATLKASVHGSINMLGLAKRTGSRILQASTSEVYGDPSQEPQSEEYWGNVNPIGVRACYDEGKRAAEALFFDYFREFRTDIRVARIFNTYGPRMSFNDGRVLSNFVLQALSGKPLTVYGTGEQTRSFCYVDDLVSGLISLFFSDSTVGPINLGNPEPYSMLELASKIIALTKSNSEIVYRPLPMDDPRNRKPDISKARILLGWEPETSLDVGLQKTIEDFKARL